MIRHFESALCKGARAIVLALVLIGVAGNAPAFAQDAQESPAAPTASSPANETAPPAQEVPQAPAAAVPASEAVSAPPADPAAQSAPVPADGSAAPDEAALDSAAPSQNVDAAPADEPRNSALPHDLSPWGMYQAADIVVKAVMIGLAFASLVTWTVALAKAIEIACARARAGRARSEILKAEGLEAAAQALAGRGGPAAFMVRTAQDEVKRADAVIDHAGSAGLKERIASHLADIEARAGRRLNTGTGVLATIGSTAPFVGLFGTVWGIMNSFIGISKAQTTNLAIVAPGIAEALLATAIGLVAAIPAVIVYNVFARQIAGYRHLLREGATGVERLVSRDLDVRTARRAAPHKVAAE